MNDVHTNEPVADTSAHNAPPEQTKGADMAKIFAIVGYILPFLFFLPLVMDDTKQNTFARYHANQHLILLIVGIAAFMLLPQFLMMGGFYMIGPIGAILSLINLAMLVLAILGIVNAAQDKMKPLPLIGGFTLIK